MEKEENAKTQKKTKKDASKEQITFSYFSYLIITNKLLFICVSSIITTAICNALLHTVNKDR